MICTHAKTGAILAHQVEPATTFWARLRGLMFRARLAPQTGLLLEPCPQIHTCFMRFAIDVVFLDKHHRVVAVIEQMKPWRMSPFFAHSHAALELPAGTLQGRVHPGDELIFTDK